MNKMKKSIKESFFVKCNIKSEVATNLLKLNPTYTIQYNDYDVIVLQVIECENSELILEIIRERDYENSFKEDKQ